MLGDILDFEAKRMGCNHEIFDGVPRTAVAAPSSVHTCRTHLFPRRSRAHTFTAFTGNHAGIDALVPRPASLWCECSDPVDGPTARW
jgi:hypothetical protein